MANTHNANENNGTNPAEKLPGYIFPATFNKTACGTHVNSCNTALTIINIIRNTISSTDTKRKARRSRNPSRLRCFMAVNNPLRSTAPTEMDSIKIHTRMKLV